jgi:hypothetical protein
MATSTTVFISKFPTLRVKTSSGWIKFASGRATVSAAQAEELKKGKGFGVDFYEETASNSQDDGDGDDNRDGATS